ALRARRTHALTCTRTRRRMLACTTSAPARLSPFAPAAGPCASEKGLEVGVLSAIGPFWVGGGWVGTFLVGGGCPSGDGGEYRSGRWIPLPSTTSGGSV